MRTARRGGPKGRGAPTDGAAGATGVATLDGPEELDGPHDGRSRRHYDPAWDAWKRPRRWPGILLSCVIVLGFLGVVVWHYRPHVSSPSRQSPFPTNHSIHAQPAFVPGIGQPATLVTSFHGTTNRAGLPFTTKGNLVLLNAKCTCSYNFVVTVSNIVNTLVAIPISHVGHYGGTVSVALPKGAFKVSVSASGPWTVQVIQPPPSTPAIATPFSYFSVGESVVGPFSAANRFLALKFLSFTSGSITVKVLDVHGALVSTAFFSRQPSEQHGNFTGLPNPYYLEITAGGFWNLDVRRNATVAPFS